MLSLLKINNIDKDLAIMVKKKKRKKEEKRKNK